MSKAEPSQTPLVELARSVPKDIRLEWEIQWSEDGAPTGHSMAPVGLYLHELAERLEAVTAERNEALSYVSREKAISSRLHGEAERAKTELINVKAERDALKDESGQRLQWYTEALIEIGKVNVKLERANATVDALKDEVERLNRLAPCRYCLEQYDPIEMHEMDYDDGPETKQFLICDDCYENHHSAEPPEQPDQFDYMGQGC